MIPLVERKLRLDCSIKSDTLKDDEASLAIASMGRFYRTTSWTFSLTGIERFRYVGTMPPTPRDDVIR